jgi:hypothetical protein
MKRSFAMTAVKNQNVSKTNKQTLSCQPIETLESRQMLSASSMDFVPPQPLNVRLALGMHTDNSHHQSQGHGSLITQINPIRWRLPIPTFFIEPKVNSDVTQWHDFSSNPLFAASGPSPKDVAQGQVGDCWFLATLAETALRDPSTIRNDIHQRADGTYDVYFHTSTTTTLDEHVDGKLPENAYGGLEYAKLGQSNCTWVAIMEKAFTYFRNRTISADYATIASGWGSEAIRDLGGTPSEILPTISNATQMFNSVIWGLILNTSMDFGTKGTGGGPLVHGHEYSVVSARVQNGVNQIEVRNPWGYNPGWTNSSNYDSTNDGYMWVNATSVYSELDEFVSASL